jgi:hypothetical protein
MQHTVSYFRHRAENCRILALIAHDARIVDELLTLARELDEEATEVGRREAARTRGNAQISR